MITSDLGQGLSANTIQRGNPLPPSRIESRSSQNTQAVQNSERATLANKNNENPLRDIAKRYDITNISLSDRVALGNELRDAGKISLLEYSVLTIADLSIDGYDIDTSQTSNLIERFQQALDLGRSSNTEEGNKVMEKLLSIAEMLNQLKDSDGVDAFA